MIKNIIFDVGDVLIEFRWKEMLMEHGLSEEQAMDIGTKMFDNPLWNELDRGVKSVSEIIEEYRACYPEDGDEIEYFITHGELMHVCREEIYEKVEKLMQMGYRIYILSNYSEILFRKHTKDVPFMDRLDGKVVSYEVHLLKPDHAIYQYLLDKYHLAAEECVFLDDRSENVQAAREVGIAACRITGRTQLGEILSGWIERNEVIL